MNNNVHATRFFFVSVFVLMLYPFADPESGFYEALSASIIWGVLVVAIWGWIGKNNGSLAATTDLENFGVPQNALSIGDKSSNAVIDDNGNVSYLSQQEVSKEQWPNICHELSLLLEEDRKCWFEGEVNDIRRYTTAGSVIIDDKLSGEVEYAMKGFQLFWVAQILPNYIRFEDGKGFTDLLWAYVCGNKTEDCMKYAQKYTEAGNDMPSKVCGDIICCITKEESPAFFLPLLTSLVFFPSQYMLIDACVAEAFKDEKTVRKMGNLLDEFYVEAEEKMKTMLPG